MNDRLDNLDYLFQPRSIAFIGATESLGKWGFIIFNNLLRGGFTGQLYPVNPGRASVLGCRAFPSVRAIPEEVDLAVFTVPAKEVPAAVAECAAKGVKAGVVISAGFKEMGGESAERERELVALARARGLVLVGPNGQGLCCPASGLYPWMPYFFPPPGPVGVISQSGNVLNILIDGVLKAGFGISKAVSSGNEADLTTGDYLAYLARDPGTEVIVSYVEGISDGKRFIERAQEASRKKPVVIYKGGRTAAGFSAAGSHTGALAVDEQLFEAACRQAGLVRVREITEAGSIAASFLQRPLPAGRRVGIVTGGGGLGVIAADVITDLGLEVPRLSPGLLEQIKAMMPDWWVPGNPVDLVAGLNFHVVQPIIELLMTSGEVDAVLLLFIGPPRLKPTPEQERNPRGMDFTKVWQAMSKQHAQFAASLFELMHRHRVPIYVVTNFQDEVEPQLKEFMGERRQAIYPAIGSACLAIKAMSDYHEYRGKT